MANPLQPKVISVLEKEYKAFVVNVTAASRSGVTDLIVCHAGLFYGFEIKWKNDQPSELQKDKINKVIDAGGKAYFIRSVADIHAVLKEGLEPVKYQLKNHFKM